MATEEKKTQISRRKFLAWGAVAAASASLAPLLAAGCGGAAPAAQPAATAGGAPAPVAPTKAVAPTQPPAKAGVIELKLDHHEPAQANLGKTFQAYADYVNKASNGAIHITVYPSETLSKAADAYTNCVNGVNDLGWTAISYYPGQFRLNEAFVLPMLGVTNGVHGARAMQEWYKTNPLIQKEWSQVHVLSSFCNGVGYLHTSKKPIRKLEDAAGMKLRCSGFGGTNFVKGIGANPQSVGIPDTYEALAKGVIDGGIMDWQAINSNRMYEILKYSCTLPLYNTSQCMAFNPKKWDSIPADLQKILQDVPGLLWQDWDPDPNRKGKQVPSLGEFFANGFDIADAPGIEQFKQAGGEMITFSADEAARWTKAAEPVWNAWIDSVKDQPWDAKKELDNLKAIMAKTK